MKTISASKHSSVHFFSNALSVRLIRNGLVLKEEKEDLKRPSMSSRMKFMVFL